MTNNETLPSSVNDLTLEEEQEIGQLEAAATKGPWESDGAEIYLAHSGMIDSDHWIGETLRVDAQEQSEADARFVARARTAVPELMKRVQGMRERIVELELAALAGREALGALLSRDLEEPPEGALGALYLLNQATAESGGEAVGAARGLAKHEADVTPGPAGELDMPTRPTSNRGDE